jgi:ATP-dependent RNA helicase RhlE
VFTRTKFGANNVAEHLTKNGIPAMALHGNKSQTARTQALAGFKNGDIRALVATDIAARGIDIDELPHVVNYEIPNVSEDYVHRIGRTGRAGNSGEAVSLVCLDEEGFMQDIERFTKQNIEVVLVPGFEADPGERAEPLAMGRQTIWGGLGKPPSREVMQAAAKAARSEMMTRIRENKPQTGRGPGTGNSGNGGGCGGNAGRGRSAGGGNGGGGGGGGGGRGPRQNTGYSQGGQGGQPAQARNPNAQPPRQQQARPHYDEDAQPTSHVSSGFPSSGQPTGGNRGGFRGGRPAGGGGGGGGGPRSGGGGGRGNGYGRSGGSGSFNGR